jgi:predicted amidophosphoribosyltransferase
MGKFFTNREFIDDGTIIAMGAYRPWGWHKQSFPNAEPYPDHSKRILDLKSMSNVGLAYFQDLLEPLLAEGIAIASVPSHDPQKAFNGVRHLAGRLSRTGKRVDASQCLVRIKKIEKLAAGGSRQVDVHLNSIEVKSGNLIQARPVLLLDDVTTSGNSLKACRQLLVAAGASAVQCVALGETRFA